MDCLPEHLQDGVIAYYPFVNGALTDASGNGNDPLNTTDASLSTDRDQRIDCAFEFDNWPNSDQLLTTTKTSFLNNLSTFSVSIWYEPLDVMSAVGQIQALVSRGDSNRCPDRKGEWSVSLYDCRRAVFGHNHSVWANFVTEYPNCEEEKVALTDKWHHVVAVYNNDTYKIYFNGALHESYSGAPGNCGNQHLAQDIGDLFIGSDYTGKIDDILIYNRELTAQEVFKLFESEPCCS